jgi:uncharacterized damage-inducible protein DinB
LAEEQSLKLKQGRLKMKHMRLFCLLVVLSFAGDALAQSKTTTTAPSPAPQAPPTIGAVVDREISMVEGEFVGAAEAMPEDKFNFAPTGLNIAGSEFKGVRTFAEQVKHVAATNYALWGPITGDKSPLDSKSENGPDSLKTKAEIIKYLKDSYAVGHKAARSLTADNMMSTFHNPFGGKNQMSGLFMVTFGVAHAFDHYGQMVEYLRMNGIIPPASRGN